MKPLVSAIVTSYNHAEYLDQRMESLFGQTYDNVEIIVVDDCSTDGSANVLEKYRGNSKVNLVLLEKNRGYAAACNLGIELSKGGYVMFAECDDYNDPSHIETLVKALEENIDAGVAFSRSHIVDEKGKIIGSDFDFRDGSFRQKCAYDTIVPKEFMRKHFLFSCVIPNMSAALIRKKCIEHIGGLSPDYLACADWDFWCRMAEKTDFYHVKDSLNYFRTHPNTVRSKASVSLQVGEYYDLLYRSHASAGFSFSETMKFRLNCGFIWASFIVVNPVDWFKSLYPLCRKSFQHDRFSLLFLVLGIGMKAVKVFQNRVLR